jgi:hypothetical protein
MKTIHPIWHNKKAVSLLFTFLFIISSLGFVQYKKGSLIKGTWISQRDHKSKWVFTADSMRMYYNNEALFTFTYTVSNSSPQCGQQVKTGPHLAFLSLKNVKSGHEQCYYINGLTDSTLSLSPFGRANILFFKKQ